MKFKNLPFATKTECTRALINAGMSASDAESAWNKNEDTACAAAAMIFKNHIDSQALTNVSVQEAMLAWRADLATWALENLKQGGS